MSEIAGSLDAGAAIPILADIATALADLDGKVVHRDLKPENVLLLNGTWCLADFGISRYAEATDDGARHPEVRPIGTIYRARAMAGTARDRGNGCLRLGHHGVRATIRRLVFYRSVLAIAAADLRSLEGSGERHHWMPDRGNAVLDMSSFVGWLPANRRRWLSSQSKTWEHPAGDTLRAVIAAVDGGG
jgi:serine/threonine protein kinase